MSEKEAYVTSKEEKQDLFVFCCVLVAFIGIEVTGVFII